MLHNDGPSYFEIFLLSIVIVMGLMVSFLPGCAAKNPNAMTVEERLEPYRYIIKDTLFRYDGVYISVGNDYYKLDNQQRIDFGQDLSWAYYPKKVSVRDEKTNRLLMTISEERYIQLIWQENLVQADKDKDKTPGPQYPSQVKDILEKGGVGDKPPASSDTPGLATPSNPGIGGNDIGGIQSPGDTSTTEPEKKDEKVKEIQ
jgi:hypothetical protein